MRALAHISLFGDSGSLDVATVVVLTTLAAVTFGAVALRAHFAKHKRWVAPHLGIGTRSVLSVAVIVALLGIATPAATGQDRTDFPVGLPDLVSDPPIPRFDRVVIDEDDGSPSRVIAFDGRLRNIGPGVLELAGNPQLDNGMEQRFWNGEEWVAVANPLVIFETTDGHDHFHLIAAAEYSPYKNP